MWRHIERSTHDRLQETILAFHAFGEAEVADLTLGALQQDIGGFEVSVDDVISAEVLDATHDLPEEVDGLFFRQFSLFLEVVVEVVVA